MEGGAVGKKKLYKGIVSFEGWNNMFRDTLVMEGLSRGYLNEDLNEEME